jgi:hypothetical protein
MRNAHVVGRDSRLRILARALIDKSDQGKFPNVAFSDSDSLGQRLHIAQFLRDTRHVLESFGNEGRSIPSVDASWVTTKPR